MIFRKKATLIETIDVIWCCYQPPEIIESVFSYDYCRKTSRQLFQSQLDLLSWHELESQDQICTYLSNKKLVADCLLIVLNPDLVIGPMAVKRMMETLKSGAGASLPVFNETPSSSLMAQLPAIYLNLSTYFEVAEMMPYDKQTVSTSEVCIDCSCVLIKKEFVDELTSIIKCGKGLRDALMSLLAHLAAQRLCVIDRSALVHAFGTYGGGQRDELVTLVPESAKMILDVGCANGGFGKLMRSNRSDIHLTGVEMNDVMAKNASRHYDRIHAGKIEDIHFEMMFDHINCGDVIEHLYDPWQMLKLLGFLLKKGGSLVISLPNAGHWTIVRDLAAGKFQYIPFGLLCITHIRWFTEKSIREALFDAGFEIKQFLREQVAPTPKGKAFIELLCQNGMGDQTSLLTNQFTIRALKK